MSKSLASAHTATYANVQAHTWNSFCNHFNLHHKLFIIYSMVRGVNALPFQLDFVFFIHFIPLVAYIRKIRRHPTINQKNSSFSIAFFAKRKEDRKKTFFPVIFTMYFLPRKALKICSTRVSPYASNKRKQKNKKQSHQMVQKKGDV